MNDIFDELGQADAEVQKPVTKKRKKDFSHVNPLEQQGVTRKETAAATTPTEGNYWLRTVKIPPEWRELFRDIKMSCGFKSLADAERWIISEGLRAYYERGHRPEFTQTIEQTAVLFTDTK